VNEAREETAPAGELDHLRAKVCIALKKGVLGEEKDEEGGNMGVGRLQVLLFAAGMQLRAGSQPSSASRPLPIISR
jgi:hypothetical protein